MQLKTPGNSTLGDFDKKQQTTNGEINQTFSRNLTFEFLKLFNCI